ncbi:hypothetical protein GCM10027562_29460 [Arthrobacter pigmenti]
MLCESTLPPVDRAAEFRSRLYIATPNDRWFAMAENYSGVQKSEADASPAGVTGRESETGSATSGATGDVIMRVGLDRCEHLLNTSLRLTQRFLPRSSAPISPAYWAPLGE